MSLIKTKKNGKKVANLLLLIIRIIRLIRFIFEQVQASLGCFLANRSLNADIFQIKICYIINSGFMCIQSH